MNTAPAGPSATTVTTALEMSAVRKVYTMGEKVKLRLLKLWDSLASLLRFVAMEIVLTVIVSIFSTNAITIITKHRIDT